MSRASWSKLGGGRLRRDCPELELARGVLDCAWARRRHACLRGCRTCCCRCAARSAEAEWRHSCRWRTGRPARPRSRCPAGAGRACSPAPSPCHARGRRLRNAHGQPRRCRRTNSRRASQRSSNLAYSTACAATLHLLRALPCLIQEALHITGPTYDLRRRLRLARTGQHVQAQLRPEAAETGKPARLQVPLPLRL